MYKEDAGAILALSSRIHQFPENIGPDYV